MGTATRGTSRENSKQTKQPKMESSPGKKLAKVSWPMRDHRNTGNNDKETAAMSIEVDIQIREEYNKGFRNVGSAARKLAGRPMALLAAKGLSYRHQWQRSITANCEFQASNKSKRQISTEIQEGKGYV